MDLRGRFKIIVHLKPILPMRKTVPYFCLVLFVLFNLQHARSGVTDSLELQSFMDGVMSTYMDENNIAGAVVSVVHNGEVIIEKGYGYADIERSIPVDPKSTLFRIASISKLFTWLSVMKLAEDGLVDLDEDVNNYIEEFQIPPNFAEPVTLRSLMSHSAGFEERLYRLFVRDPSQFQPLGKLLSEQLPERVRPPLKHASYSNHGTGVAQYVVEQVTGMPFEDYAEKRILNPFGMNNTTFRQPLPENLAAGLSNGYTFSNGSFREMYFEYIPMKGVGGASATASDMALFMNALLNGTCMGEYCLIDSATYAKMKEPVLIHSRGMNPTLHGFSDMSLNNTEIIGHGGATFWFHSILAIFPEHDIGLFVSFNSSGGSGISRKVLERFAGRYFPDDRPLTGTMTLAEERLELLAGNYVSNRRTHSDFMKIRALENITIISVDDGRLRMEEPGGNISLWLPVDEITFRNEESNELIAFGFEEDRADYMFRQRSPFIVYERLSGLNSVGLHRALFFIIVITIIYILAGWPALFFARRRYRPVKRKQEKLPVDAKLGAWLCSACFAAAYILLNTAFGSGREMILEIPSAMKAGLIFPFLSMPFLVFMIWRYMDIWKMRRLGFRNKLFYLVVIIVFGVALIQLHYWNLLGWKY